jgi:hypothetical protein
VLNVGSRMVWGRETDGVIVARLKMPCGLGMSRVTARNKFRSTRATEELLNDSELPSSR